MELLKVATAARYFKEAARISIKAKLLYVEKKTIQIDMNMITLNLEPPRKKLGGHSSPINYVCNSQCSLLLLRCFIGCGGQYQSRGTR